MILPEEVKPAHLEVTFPAAGERDSPGIQARCKVQISFIDGTPGSP